MAASLPDNNLDTMASKYLIYGLVDPRDGQLRKAKHTGGYSFTYLAH